MSNNLEGEIVWKGTSRRISWSIISHMRLFLKVDVHPVISTSFMIINNYYQSKKHKNYKLYILIITSVFVICKQNEISRSMSYIFCCLLNICREFSQKISDEILKSTTELNDFTNRQLTNNEIIMINNCELDLIELNNYQLNIDMPLNYTSQYVQPNITILPKGISKKIEDSLLRYLCVILCSEHYNDFQPEIMAAAASLITFEDFQIEIPKIIIDWITDIISKYGEQEINNAKFLLKHEFEIITK